MAVINIDREMPESCGMCDHRTVCTVFGKGWADANNRYSLGVHSRLDNCPMKSVEGLIEKIEQDDEIFMCIKSNYTTTEAVIPLWRLRQIIKEYCGGEQE